MCLHDWELIAIMHHAPTDERDRIAHTSMYLIGCWACRAVDAFPVANAALVTARYAEQLRRELRAGGWRPPLRWIDPR